MGIKSDLLKSVVSKKKAAKTEYEKAHAIAQRNASLPVEQGGLGLPTDNTAMDRARAMGFDVDNRFYHGTSQDIAAFDINKAGSSGTPKTGGDKLIWASDNPKSANYYTGDKPDLYRRYVNDSFLRINDKNKLSTEEKLELLDRLAGGEGKSIYPILVAKSKPVFFDSKGRVTTNRGNAKKGIKEIKEGNADSIIIKNTQGFNQEPSANRCV